MGDQHNKARYGEVWDQTRIDLCLEVLEALKSDVVLSGGWAWHMMSPVDHTELKHAHDHKDMDLFVPPVNVGSVVVLLKSLGFEKVWTKYDRLESAEEFRRYEKTVVPTPRHDKDCERGLAGQEIFGGKNSADCCAEGFVAPKGIRLTIDFFVRDVPERLVQGFRVVEPATLLTFYSNIHSSDKCFAVKAAVKLISSGVDPVGRKELVSIPA